MPTAPSTSSGRCPEGWNWRSHGSRRATNSTTANCDVASTSERYPVIVGTLTGVECRDAHPNYVVTGDIAFHGKTRAFEHEMQIVAGPTGVTLTGESQFDIRQFGMKPPSMLMVRVYPEINVRIELLGTPHAGENRDTHEESHRIGRVSWRFMPVGRRAH